MQSLDLARLVAADPYSNVTLTGDGSVHVDMVRADGYTRTALARPLPAALRDALMATCVRVRAEVRLTAATAEDASSGTGVRFVMYPALASAAAPGAELQFVAGVHASGVSPLHMRFAYASHRNATHAAAPCALYACLDGCDATCTFSTRGAVAVPLDALGRTPWLAFEFEQLADTGTLVRVWRVDTGYVYIEYTFAKDEGAASPATTLALGASRAGALEVRRLAYTPTCTPEPTPEPTPVARTRTPSAQPTRAPSARPTRTPSAPPTPVPTPAPLTAAPTLLALTPAPSHAVSTSVDVPEASAVPWFTFVTLVLVLVCIAFGVRRHRAAVRVHDHVRHARVERAVERAERRQTSAHRRRRHRVAPEDVVSVSVLESSESESESEAADDADNVTANTPPPRPRGPPPKPPRAFRYSTSTDDDIDDDEMRTRCEEDTDTADEMMTRCEEDTDTADEMTTRRRHAADEMATRRRHAADEMTTRRRQSKAAARGRRDTATSRRPDDETSTSGDETMTSSDADAAGHEATYSEDELLWPAGTIYVASLSPKGGGADAARDGYAC